MTDKLASNKTPFKKFYVGGRWDEIFRMPAPAFHIWMFYYRLEGRVREGWATRENICKKLGINKDTFRKWRNWLIKYEWLEQVGTRNSNGEYKIPVMRVRRGIIPKTEPRLKVSDMVKAREKRKFQSRQGLKASATDGLKASATARTETFSPDVDKYYYVDKKPDVDGAKPAHDGQKVFEEPVGENLEAVLPKGIYRTSDGRLMIDEEAL